MLNSLDLLAQVHFSDLCCRCRLDAGSTGRAHLVERVESGLERGIGVLALGLDGALGRLDLALVSRLDAKSSPQDRSDGAPDPVDLVRKAVANLQARQLAQRDYTYVERDRITTNGGTVSNTYEIILLEGRPYRQWRKMGHRTTGILRQYCRFLRIQRRIVYRYRRRAAS